MVAWLGSANRVEQDPPRPPTGASFILSVVPFSFVPGLDKAEEERQQKEYEDRKRKKREEAAKAQAGRQRQRLEREKRRQEELAQKASEVEVMRQKEENVAMGVEERTQVRAGRMLEPEPLL